MKDIRCHKMKRTKKTKKDILNIFNNRRGNVKNINILICNFGRTTNKILNNNVSISCDSLSFFTLKISVYLYDS